MIVSAGPKIAILALTLSVSTAVVSFAQESPTESAVRAASERFVVQFNNQNAKRLGRFYTASGSLKLPDAASVSGRKDIRAAWQGGFDNGLGNLNLEITNIDDTGAGKVVESGTYELEINTPNGKLLQTGTYSVQWEYNAILYYYFGFIRPKIDFDAIDAQSTVPVSQ